MPILVMEGGLFFLAHHETYGGAVVYLPQFMPILVMEGGLLFLAHHEHMAVLWSTCHNSCLSWLWKVVCSV